jgi:hypothetical protein
VLEWRWGDESLGEDKTNIYFVRTELLEWSIVPIGSNPDAHIREAKTIEEMRAALPALENIPTPEVPVVDTAKLSVRKAKLMLNQNRF